MRLIFSYIFRNIRRNWISVVLEVISLSLAASVLYLSINASGDVLLAARESVEAYTGGFDLVLTPGEEPLAFSSLSFSPGDAVVPVRGVAYQIPSLGPDIYAMAFSTAPAVLLEKGFATLSEGRVPEKDGEVVITESKAEFFSLSLGEDLVLVEEETGEEKVLHIVGILSSMKEFSNERPDLLECMILEDGSSTPEKILVDVGETDVARYAEALRKSAEGWKVEVLALEATAEISSSMGRVLQVLIGVTVVLAVSVIYTVSSLLLGERLPVYATFRSVGATYSRLRGILLLENLAYGLLGGLVGIGAGEGLRALVLSRYYFVEVASRPFDLLLALAVVAFSVLVQLSVAFLFSLRLTSHSVRFHLSESVSSEAKVSWPLCILGVALLLLSVVLHLSNTRYRFLQELIALVLAILGANGALPALSYGVSVLLSPLAKGPVFLALRNLRGGKNNVSTLRLTAMVVALSTVIAFAVSSVSTFYREYEKNYDFDLYVRGADLTPEMITYAVTREGVAKVTEEYWTRRDVTIGEETSYVCFVKARGYLNGISFLEGNDLFLSKGYAIVDALYAARNGIKVGDKVSLVVSGLEKPLVLKVKSFCDSGIYNTSRRTIILSSADYAACFGDMPTRIDIKMKWGFDLEDVMERVSLYSYLHLDRDITVGTRESLLGKEVSRAKSTIPVFSLIPLYVLVLSVLGLYNNQTMSFRQRRREYAVLYSVAMSRRQLGRMMVVEALAVFLLGTLSGVALGAYLTSVMERIVFSVLAYIRMEMRPLDLLAPLGVALALVLFGAVGSLKRIGGLDVVGEIRNE